MGFLRSCVQVQCTTLLWGWQEKARKVGGSVVVPPLFGSLPQLFNYPAIQPFTHPYTGGRALWNSEQLTAVLPQRKLLGQSPPPPLFLEKESQSQNNYRNTNLCPFSARMGQDARQPGVAGIPGRCGGRRCGMQPVCICSCVVRPTVLYLLCGLNRTHPGFLGGRAQKRDDDRGCSIPPR
jgi:hypothetical protein